VLSRRGALGAAAAACAAAALAVASGRGRAAPPPHPVVGVPLWAPPFGAPARGGGWVGLDVALARGVAAALAGSPAGGRRLPLEPGQRLWAVTSGAARVVAAAYASPGGAPPRLPAGVTPVGPYYAEPVAVVVRRGRPIASWRQLDGEVVGLLPGAAGAGALRAAAAAAGASPVLLEEPDAGRAAEGLALGRIRALLGGEAPCRALAAYDPELRAEPVPAFGFQSYWALAGPGEAAAAARRAVAGLPRGAALASALRAWAAAAAPPPLPAPPLLTPPPGAA
jgi:ABC-type amino acid transport substrate-binding protein